MGGRVAYIISITGNYETFDVKMALHMFMVTYFTPGTVYALACSASGLDANEADAAWRDWGAVLKHVATTFRVELD
jgi:hypothetical protein